MLEFIHSLQEKNPTGTKHSNVFGWHSENFDLEEETIKFDSGMGLVMNSLIAHKVTPVTKGERITLTYWAMGPLWR